MEDVKRRTAIKNFINYWKEKAVEKGQLDEKQDCHAFWISLLREVFNIDTPEKYLAFEYPVQLNNKSWIDVYIEDTKVLIEQKSSDIDLDKKYKQSDGKYLTPLEQARRYKNELKWDKQPRWLIACNFNEFQFVDLNEEKPEIQTVFLKDLEKEYHRLGFLVDSNSEHTHKEEQISKKAGDIIGLLYDALLKQYGDKINDENLKNLNKLCVRLVFCLYAEDAGIFEERDMFLNYMKQYPTKDMRDNLIKLFKVLDTKKENRDPFLNDDLAAFPHVNGGLFKDEDIVIPQFTDEIRKLLLVDASANFDWSDISPTIFGALFESTLNPETRHNGGMHYTSIENIHKVIDPLFMDELNKRFKSICEYKDIKTRNKRLKEFQNEIANLTFLDPACGSGNFLTETYISLRKLENKIISELYPRQTWLGDITTPIKVSINQMFGIEINDFAASVAQTALWIAESQMLKETENIIKEDIDDFLPLKPYSNIIEGNALRVNWEDVVPKDKLSYIIGNPPFVGKNDQSELQKNDMLHVFGNKWEKLGELDYVSAWYKKATDLMKGTNICSALVSTNSITQGQQVPILWKPLFEQGVHIDFAYRTFRWDSEANIKAHVHCVIIGFSYTNKTKRLYFDKQKVTAKNINAYLIDADNIFITERRKPIQNVQEIRMGSMPNDDKGRLSNFSTEEKNRIVEKYPETKKFFKLFYGANEFLSGDESRWCLWLKDVNPSEIKAQPIIDAIQKVKEKRASSDRPETQKLALVPYLFAEIRQPETNYLIVPRHSSENRSYLPIAYVDKDIICGDHNTLIADASLYTFGILCSNIHNIWMRTVCGRIKSDFRYSNTIVYNNFPWCSPTDEQKDKIKQTAQKILNARQEYNSCLEDLYNENKMPINLLKAHQENDKVVMEVYGFRKKDKNGKITELSETEIITALFKMYQKLSDKTK